MKCGLTIKIQSYAMCKSMMSKQCVPLSLYLDQHYELLHWNSEVFC